MKGRLSFTTGEEVSLKNGYIHELCLRKIAQALSDETLYIERRYGDVSVVISAFSVYVMYPSMFVTIWPLLRITYTLAHELLHLLFCITARVVHSTVCKAKSTARNLEYVHIQKEFILVTPIVPVNGARTRLLHRHQDRGCSDSAPNDNLSRRNPGIIPAALRVVQLL